MTVIIETERGRESVQQRLSSFGLVEEARAIDDRRIWAKISDQTRSSLAQKENTIRNSEGVSNCIILKTQYMP